MSLSQDLAQVEAAPPNQADPVEVELNGHLYELVFRQATGEEWAAATARRPPRPDQPIDRTYGYNIHGVIPDIAEVTCTLKRDGEPVEPIVEPWSPQNRNPINEWRRFFANIDGGAFNRITDVVFALNQWEPDQRTKNLGKAFRVASGQNSSSPAS